MTIILAQMDTFVFFGGKENIVEKGENASNQHFLHLRQCFQKSSGWLTLYLSNMWRKKPFERSLLKALWEKEKNAGNQHFSISYNIFYNIFHFFNYIYSLVCNCFQIGLVFGKGRTLSKTSPEFHV